MPRDAPPNQREWLLKRNCSLTPRQTLRAYGLLLALSLVVGTTFALRGAPFVLCFSALEMAAVTAAYLYYSRHALDHERIVLAGRTLVIERVVGPRIERHRCDAHRTRVTPPGAFGELVTLETPDGELRIGAPLAASHRAAFARELDGLLRGGVIPGWA